LPSRKIAERPRLGFHEPSLLVFDEIEHTRSSIGRTAMQPSPGKRPKNREVEDEMIRPPAKPDGPPRPATEPAKSASKSGEKNRPGNRGQRS
jgi:hypothetical protein